MRAIQTGLGIAVLLVLSGMNIMSSNAAASGYEEGEAPDRTFFLERTGGMENGKSYVTQLIPAFPGEWWLELLEFDGGAVEVSVYHALETGPPIAEMSLETVGAESMHLSVTAAALYEVVFRMEGPPGSAVLKERFISTLPPPPELPPFETVQHAPIHIWSEADYLDTSNDIYGSGTEEDPYIIEGWEISGGVEDGIWVFESDSYLVIRDCFIHSVGYPSAGIYLFVTSNVVIENCYIENCIGSEICIGSCSSILVADCVIWSDVYAYQSTGCMLKDNVLSNSRLMLQQCTDMNVHANTLRDGVIASYFIVCDSCLIYNNNFLNNEQNVYMSDCLVVEWDYGPIVGGNFWSDYGGVDADGDGFGDTPYEVASGYVDRYPLVLPYQG